MIATRRTPTDGELSRLLTTWLGFSAAVVFSIWVILTDPAKMQNVPLGLGRYISFVPPALVAAGALTGAVWFFGAWSVAARLSYVSCLMYFSCLKTLGWSFVPWALIVLAATGYFFARGSRIENRPSLLLLHLMGTMAALYTAFRLDDFLQGWVPLQSVVRSLWLLTVN